MKSSTWWWIGGIVLVIIIIIVVVMMNKKKAANPSGAAGASSTGGGNVVKEPDTLKKGTSGNRVKALQKFLNENQPSPLAKLTVDGLFGDDTENSLYQWLNALSPPQPAKQVTYEFMKSRLVPKYIDANDKLV